MSDLPKCRLCGSDAATHKVFGGIKYCCSSETCTMHDVLMLKSQWCTLMTQQHPDQDRLRFKSACEISGEKHPEYVRGYEAAIDAVCMTKQAGEPVAWEFQHEDTGLIDFVDPQQVEWGFEKNNPRWQKIGPVYRWHAQAQPDGEIVVTWDESQTRIIAVTRQDAEGKVLSVIAEAQPAPIPTAWQPIETAPEGVHVLVHYAKHITDLDPKWEWESDAQRTFVAMRNADYWVQDVGIGQSGIVEPTHWQPLPPAPGGEG